MALLHDALEDSDGAGVSGLRQELSVVFGEHVTEAVDVLTKPAHDAYGSEETRDDAYFSRLRAGPPAAKIVKVFDRLNNLACIHDNPGKVPEYVAETRRYHLPLAGEVDPSLAAKMERLILRLDPKLTNFRDNLYVDRNHEIFQGPLFVGPKGGLKKKARYLASRHSEDAVTWSVFRTLSRVAPCRWLGGFVRGATGVGPPILNADMTDMDFEYIRFWPHVPAPQSRLLWLLDHLDDARIQESKGASTDPGRLERIRRRLDSYREKALRGRLVRGIAVLEGETELDVLIDHPRFLVAVEAKYLSDLTPDTTWDQERDQLGRVIDIAIELSLQRGKRCFAVLVTDRRSHDPPKLYERLAPRYQADEDFLREKLPHRTAEELDRLWGVGWVTWREVLAGIDQRGLSECERQLLCGLIAYLRNRELL